MSAPAAGSHLVDRLNKATLLNLALNQATGPRRAYSLPSREELTGLFPDLQIQDLIGTGGMGCVYRARQTRLDRTIAVKILPKELAKDTQFAERFAREARALARLNHPNIVRVYDFGSAGDLCFLLMEHMDGMNLRELLDAGKLSAVEAVRIFEQVAAALSFAHAEGVIHRDIKPENILFSKAGHISLADFGLARLAVDSGCEVSLTQTRQAMGTLNYMAPEQWDNPRSVDHRADIYAMGILLYELLTGRVPRGSFPPASTLVAIPPAVDEVIHRALQVDPDRRFASIGEMTQDLISAVCPSTASEIDERGTLTQVLNFAGIIANRLPQPATGFKPASADSDSRSLRISLFITILIGILFLLPWYRNQSNSIQGFQTLTTVEFIEIPNLLILFAAAGVALLVRYRQAIHPVRACFVALIVTGAGIALNISLLVAGFERATPGFNFTTMDALPLEDGKMTVVPFFSLALLIILQIENVVWLFQTAVLPLFGFAWNSVVSPAQRFVSSSMERNRQKQEARRQWLHDRLKDAGNLIRGKRDNNPNGKSTNVRT